VRSKKQSVTPLYNQPRPHPLRAHGQVRPIRRSLVSASTITPSAPVSSRTATDTHGAEQVRGFARPSLRASVVTDVLPVSERRRPFTDTPRLIDGIERERDGDRHDGPQHCHRSQSSVHGRRSSRRRSFLVDERSSARSSPGPPLLVGRPSVGRHVEPPFMDRAAVTGERLTDTEFCALLLPGLRSGASPARRSCARRERPPRTPARRRHRSARRWPEVRRVGISFTLERSHAEPPSVSTNAHTESSCWNHRSRALPVSRVAVRRRIARRSRRR